MTKKMIEQYVILDMDDNIVENKEDMDAAKKRGDMTLSVYYQGKVMACNEIRCGMKMESQYVI